MSTSFSPQLGDRFADRYELKSPLRGDGAVRAFLAFDHHSGLDVALVLFDPACAHPNAWSAFARIVAAATAGKIAGLVLPQGVGSTPPVPPFCLAEPQVLRGFDRLRDQGPMPWQRALTLGERAAEILHAAHAATGVAHRALMPSRCAVTVRDDVRVLDLGVAELELGRPDEAGYRAPEQQQGGGDARSDVYTLAVMLFELISGQKSAGKAPPRLRSLVAVPRAVDEFLARALSQDPAQRPADLGAMRAAIRELLGAAAAPAEPTPGPSSGLKPGVSPVSIISAPPGASVAPSAPAKPAVAVTSPANVVSPPVTSAKPGSVNVGTTPAASAKPGPVNVGTPPAAASVGSPAPARSSAAAPSRPEAVPRPSPAIGPRGGPPGAPDLRMPSVTGPEEHGLEDRAEELEVPRRPTAAAADRTEVLAGASPPAAAAADRTEVLVGASRPAAAVVDRTEFLPAVAAPKPVDPERTEVVRPDIAMVREEEKTAPRKPLRGSLAALALARAMPGAAPTGPAAGSWMTTGDDPPTEKIVKPMLPADTTLLLPDAARSLPVELRPAAEVRPPTPESGRPGPSEAQPAPDDRTLSFERVRPPVVPGPPAVQSVSPGPVGVQPAAEVRPPPSVDADEATTVFAPVRAPASAKPAEDPFRKALIWINVVCFSTIVLALLWLLIT